MKYRGLQSNDEEGPSISKVIAKELVVMNHFFGTTPYRCVTQASAVRTTAMRQQKKKKIKKLSVTCLEGAQKLWSKQLFSVLFFSLTFAIVVCTTGNRHTGCDSSQTWMSATSLLIISASLAQLITTRKMKWFHLQAAHMATFCPIQPRLLAPGRIIGDWTAAVCFISVPDLQSTLCRGNTNLPIKIRCEQFAPWLRHIAIVFIWKKKKSCVPFCHRRQ